MSTKKQRKIILVLTSAVALFAILTLMVGPVSASRFGDERGGSLSTTSQKEEITGMVTELTATTITVDGRVLPLDPQVELNGNIQPGDTVKVAMEVDGNGNMVVVEVEITHPESFANQDPNDDHDSDSLDASSVHTDTEDYNDSADHDVEIGSHSSSSGSEDQNTGVSSSSSDDHESGHD